MQKTINLTTELPKLEAKGDYDGILKLLKCVQQQIPLTERKDHQALHMNMARAHQAMRDYASAGAEYTKAFNLVPAKYLLYLLGIAQLHSRDITNGFRNYGYRWLSDEMQPYYQALRTKGVPYLSNWSELVGKHVLVTGEQGFGDELMFGRAVHEAAKHTQSLTRLCPEQLAAFFAHNLPGTNLSIKKPSELPPEFISENFDTIVTVGDLFMFYVLEYGKLPPVPKYTAPNPAYIDGRRPKIGFVYSPGALGDNANERAINPKMFRPFMKDYDFHSFQVGAPRVIGTDHSPYINSFADTADLLDGMDCAVTCDTAFAHLALCMGKPTLLVYDKYVDWRFKVGMYPAAKLLSMTDRDFDKKFHDFVGGTK
jgi:hypothetical protein